MKALIIWCLGLLVLFVAVDVVDCGLSPEVRDKLERVLLSLRHNHNDNTDLESDEKDHEKDQEKEQESENSSMEAEQVKEEPLNSEPDGTLSPAEQEVMDVFGNERVCSGAFWVDYEYLLHRCFDDVENVEILKKTCEYVKKMDKPFLDMSRKGYVEIGKKLTKYVPLMRCVTYIADLQEKYLGRTCSEKIPGYYGCLCEGEEEKVGKCRSLFPTSDEQKAKLKEEMKAIAAEADKYKRIKDNATKPEIETEDKRLLRELIEQLNQESI